MTVGEREVCLDADFLGSGADEVIVYEEDAAVAPCIECIYKSLRKRR